MARTVSKTDLEEKKGQSFFRSALGVATKLGYTVIEEEFRKFIQNPVLSLIRKTPTADPNVIDADSDSSTFYRNEADEDVAKNLTTVRALLYVETAALCVCVATPVPQSERTTCDFPSACPLSHNATRTHFVVPNATIDDVDAALRSPIEYATKREIGWTRREILKPWQAPLPHAARHGECDVCGYDDEPPTSFCPKCRSVAYCSDTCCELAAKRKDHYGGKCVDRSQTDAVRRWQQVAVASGLASDSTELDRIAELCAVVDHVLFNPDSPMVQLGRHNRHLCGSVCTVANIFFDVASETDGAIGFDLQRHANARRFGRKTEEPFEPIEPYRGCSRAPAFREECGSDLDRIRELLGLIEPNVRLELLMWHFERIKCDDTLVLVDAKGMPLDGEKDLFPVTSAHWDYSELVYSERENKRICGAHGMIGDVKDDNEEEEEEMSENKQPLNRSGSAKKKRGKKKKSKKKSK